MLDPRQTPGQRFSPVRGDAGGGEGPLLTARWRDIDPFRQPDWRWRRVCALVNYPGSPRRCVRGDDDYVKTARAFLVRRKFRDAVDSPSIALLYDEYPDLAAAWHLHERGSSTIGDVGAEFQVRARLLAGQTDEAIAGLLGTSPAAICWYEALFFNIRDRLHARDWVMHRVIVPAVIAQYGQRAYQGVEYGVAHPIYDATLLLFGYYGGAVAVDVLTQFGFTHDSLPSTPEDVPGWLDRSWKVRLRSRSTVAAILSRFGGEQIMPLFGLHAQLMVAAQQHAGDRSAREQGIVEAMQAVVTTAPFSTGRVGALLAQKTKLNAFDDTGFEPRAHELVAAGLGRPISAPAMPERK